MLEIVGGGFPCPSPTNSPTLTGTPSNTKTVSPSVTPSVSPSITPTASPSPSSTASPSKTPTVSPSPTLTNTPTFTDTATPTASPSNTPLASPTPSVTPSFTYTPVMALTKTANVSMATIGQTITYTLAYSNGSGVTVTENLWDTISTYLTYVGSSPVGTVAGGVISWSISVTPTASGQVYFWGTVNGYPLLPELLQPTVAMARREDLDLLFGLLPQDCGNL